MNYPMEKHALIRSATLRLHPLSSHPVMVAAVEDYWRLNDAMEHDTPPWYAMISHLFEIVDLSREQLDLIADGNPIDWVRAWGS